MKLRKERSENGSFFRKRKVSGKKKIVIGTAVVLTVSVAAGGVYWRYQSGKRPSAPEKTVQATKATAEISSISNTIVGTGNLEADTPVSLKIPSGITISEVKVESGDHVSSGDVLAEVDSSSGRRYNLLYAGAWSTSCSFCRRKNGCGSGRSCYRSIRRRYGDCNSVFRNADRRNSRKGI